MRTSQSATCKTAPVTQRFMLIITMVFQLRKPCLQVALGLG
jgi:hypothetical protein